MKMKKKMIAIMMLIILLSSNLLTLGSQVIAASNDLTNQNNKTNNTNVEFNSYLDGQTHENILNTAEGGKIYIQLLVKENGYLKNGIVEFQNANFKINSSQIQSEYIQKIEGNTIYLEQIHNEENILIELPIILEKNNTMDSNYFFRDSQTIFKANYVNGNGTEKKVEKTITNRIGWKTEPTVEANAEITKYIPYHIGDEYGVLMQARVLTGLKDNAAPIENTKLEINVPVIQNVKPERTTVVANSTKATNGIENGNEFKKENYNYDSENGKLYIQVNNEPNAEGKIAWKDGKDEYIITYIYTGEEIYNFAKNTIEQAKNIKQTEETIQQEENNSVAITGSMEIKTFIKIYNAEETIKEFQGKLPYNLQEKIGNISNFSMNIPQSISKAYLYANYIKEQSGKQELIESEEETSYNLTLHTQIYDIKLNNEIEWKVNNENLVGNTTYTAGENIIIKQIKISEVIFQKMLGEDGKIDVIANDGTVIGTISKDTQKDENGNYLLNIEEHKKNEVTIKTSSPITEGSVDIQITKAFSLKHNYNKEQMQSFSKMKTEVVSKTNTNAETLKGEIALQELTSKAEISIPDGKENLSTVIQNKDVQIRAVLDTSSIENALYENPTVKIKLPSYISKIDIKSADVLMDNNLKIKKIEQQKENGAPVIIIQLEGTQTDYTIGAEYKGAMILINTDITVEKLTPSNENKIEMTFTNESKVSTNQNGTAETAINFIAPTGVVAANGIKDYAENAQDITSVSTEEVDATVETYKSTKIATVTGTIVNNYENDISNLVVLGRLPSKDNKKIDSNEDFGSTFDAIIHSEITLTGIAKENYTIYYSNKVDATKDLNDANNGWGTQCTKATKSYMIVANENYVMPKQTTIEFQYEIEIPANLTYNNNSYQMYKIYYTNVSEAAIMQETKESPILALTSGKGPELEVKLERNASVVKEGQMVRMNVVIKNTGSTATTATTIHIPKPNNTTLYSYKESEGFSLLNGNEGTIKVGKIEPGETINAPYYIKIDTPIQDETELINQVNVSAEELQNVIPSNEDRVAIEKSNIEVLLVGDDFEKSKVQKGQEMVFSLYVNKSYGEEDLKNVTVKIPILEGTTYKEAKLTDISIGNSANNQETTSQINYDESSRTLQVLIPTLGLRTKINSIYNSG